MSRPPESGPEAEGREPTDTEADDPRLRRRIEQLVPDLVKRTFYAGLGALFTTEEGIRRLANDFQLPKDVVAYLINQAGSTKDELFKVFARELHGFFQSVNVSHELKKLLTSLSFEIKTEIRFIPNDEAVGGVKPNLKNDVAVKRSSKPAPAPGPRKDPQRDED